MVSKIYFILLCFCVPIYAYSQLACKSVLNVSLGTDGTAILTPEILLAYPPNPAITYTLSKSTFTCADIGTPQIVIVFELSGSDTVNACVTEVNVEDKLLPPACGGTSITCISELNVSLGTDGTATLDVSTFLAFPPNPARTYSLSKSTFTCADIGIPQDVIVYELAGTEIVNSCFTTVNVEDKFSPPVCTPPSLSCIEILNLSLGEDGTASLSAMDVLAGLPEPGFTYNVSPSSFDCTNIGLNEVVLTATTSAGVSNQCIISVNVEDKRPGPPPCLSLIFERIRFLPNDLWLYPVPPLTFVPFEAAIISEPISQNAKAELIFAISHDEIFDAQDVIVYQSRIKAKKKSNSIDVAGAFQIPGQIQTGNYFLLSDVFSGKKKTDIGLKTFVLPIEIGYGQNRKIIKPISSENGMIYPNPFDGIISINLEEAPLQSVEVYNFTGQLVKNKIYSESNSLQDEIDLSGLSAGNYFLKIRDKEGQIFTERIVKN